ncbi:MAG: acyltransferase family protein [Parvularculaceae bacterium]
MRNESADRADALGGYVHSLDGLRAVAVFLVLLFHAGFKSFQGGFIGVDVFFVISGFLITRNIERQLINGSWSFSSFYSRRIARLSPALFVTVLATFTAGLFILSPDDFARLGRVGLYASLSVSNVFFWLESGYFDQSAHTKPLLHTWSLGVEEQFYLFWPLIIFTFYQFGRIKAASLGLLVMGLVSLAAALHFIREGSSAVFFLTPFRVYQFALGGLVALGLRLRAERRRDIVGWISAIAIVVLALTASGDIQNLWLNAVAPAVAAAAFIWSAEAKTIRAVFASAPFVWVGRRSYSIYLVHWPLIVFWRMAGNVHFSTLESVLALVFPILAGAGLHVAVEKPLRITGRVSASGAGRRLSATAGLMIVCLVTGAHIWGLLGIPSRVPPQMRKIAETVHPLWNQRLKQVREGYCNIGEKISPADFDVKRCATPPPGKRAYLVIGDSYGADSYIILRRAYPDIYFGQFTAPGCLLRQPQETPVERAPARCAESYKKAFQLAASGRFDGVVFAADWRSKYEDAIIDNLIVWARMRGLDVVLLGYRPRFAETAPTIVSKAVSPASANRLAQSLLVRSRREKALRLEKRLGGNVKLVNPFDLLCTSVCPIIDENDSILYLDGSHLSMSGIALAARRLAKSSPHLFAPPGADTKSDVQ